MARPDGAGRSDHRAGRGSALVRDRLARPAPGPVHPKPKVPTRAEIEAFRRLVQAANEFDQQTGQPHCEDPEKIKLLDAINKLADRLDAIEKRLAAQDSADAEDAAAITASVET
uniref:Terminase small subunit n=1 Tax=Caulobacter phage S2L TaxID=3348356 RepID=A0AB74UJI2_9VIRU